MAGTTRGTRRLHGEGVSPQQRVSVAALLIFLLVSPLSFAGEIDFDPDISQEDFALFSALVAQAIYATPVEPARGRGLFAFDIGVAANAIPIDGEASYWAKAVGEDFLTEDYLVVPRIVASKGLGVANVSGSYARIPDTDIEIFGGALDIPILDGGLATPTVAVRGSYTQLSGVDELDLKTYGAEAFISKAFGPVTPYGGVGIMRVQSEGRIEADNFPTILLEDESDYERITAGVRISLLVPKIVIEATRGEEEITYAAKLSLGF